MNCTFSIRFPARRAGSSLPSLLFASAVCLILIGCSKPTSPAQEANSDQQSASNNSATAEPQPKSPEEIIAAFETLDPKDRDSAAISEVAQLPEASDAIESIDLTDSRISDTDIQPLKNLSKLKSVNLTNVPISGAALEAFTELPALEELILDGTQVGNDVAPHLLEMENLQTVSLRKTGITDQIFKSLAEMPQLTRLHVDGNRILLGKEFARLVEEGKFAKLRVLTVDGSQFGLYGFQSASQLNALERLSVTDSGFHDAALGEVAGCEALREFSADSTSVSDAGVEELQNLRSLKVLHLRNCPAITNDSLKTLRQMKSLERVDLSGTSCTPEGLKSLQNQLPETVVVGF